MDFLLDYLHDYLHNAQTHLSPSLLFKAHSAFTTLTSTLTTIRSLTYPLVSRFTSNPDLTTVVVLLIIAFVSIKIFKYVFGAIMFWVRLVTNLAFYGVLVVGGFYVWQRGVEGTVEDLTGLVGFWTGEYQRFQRAQEQSASTYGRSAGGGHGRNAARGRGKGRQGWR